MDAALKARIEQLGRQALRKAASRLVGHSGWMHTTSQGHADLCEVLEHALDLRVRLGQCSAVESSKARLWCDWAITLQLPAEITVDAYEASPQAAAALLRAAARK